MLFKTRKKSFQHLTIWLRSQMIGSVLCCVQKGLHVQQSTSHSPKQHMYSLVICLITSILKHNFNQALHGTHFIRNTHSRLAVEYYKTKLVLKCAKQKYHKLKMYFIQKSHSFKQYLIIFLLNKVHFK